MAEQKKADANCTPHPFDVPTVQHLIKLMSEHDLTEVHLEEGNQVIRLRRGPKHVPMSMPTLPLQASVPATTALATAPSHSGLNIPAPVPAPIGKKVLEIKSPTPGTFYRSSSPDAEAYVKIGSKVKNDTVVCIIEAMKVFNEIPAEVSGTIVAIKVEDKQPVEYGQVLFHVEPS